MGTSISGIRGDRLSSADYEKNFSDLHPPLDRHQALVAADRCYFCYDAPCMTACPTSIDIPMFIRQISTGNAVGAAFTNRRVLEPVESRIMLTVGVALLALAILFAKFPRVLAYPVIVVCVWIAIALLYKGYKLRRRKDRQER